MEYQIKFLPTAIEDLKYIEDYYIVEFGIESSLKVIDSILNSIERLTVFPNSGSLTPDDFLNQEGYRMIVCDKYVSIYRLVDEIIYIYHIANTQTEYTKLFY